MDGREGADMARRVSVTAVCLLAAASAAAQLVKENGLAPAAGAAYAELPDC